MRYIPEVFAPGYGLLYEKEYSSYATAREAWGHLAKLRERQEDEKPVYVTEGVEACEYTEVVETLRLLASAEGEEFYGDPRTLNPIDPDGTGEVWGFDTSFAEDEEDAPRFCYRVVRGA